LVGKGGEKKVEKIKVENLICLIGKNAYALAHGFYLIFILFYFLTFAFLGSVDSFFYFIFYFLCDVASYFSSFFFLFSFDFLGTMGVIVLCFVLLCFIYFN